MKNIIDISTRKSLLTEFKINNFNVNEDKKRFIGLNELTNPKAFIEKFVKLNDNGCINDFKLTDKQNELLEKIGTDKTAIYEEWMPRRSGATTLLCAYILWEAVTNQDKTIFSSADNHAVSISIGKIIKEMYNNLPSDIKPKIVEDKVDSISFENGSMIKFSNFKSCSYKGVSTSLVVLHGFSNVKSRWCDVDNLIHCITAGMTRYSPVFLY